MRKEETRKTNFVQSRLDEFEISHYFACKRVEVETLNESSVRTSHAEEDWVVRQEVARQEGSGMDVIDLIQGLS